MVAASEAAKYAFVAEAVQMNAVTVFYDLKMLTMFFRV